MSLKEVADGLPQAFLSLNSILRFNINADYRVFSEQLSKRTAKHEQATKKNDEEYLLTKH